MVCVLTPWNIDDHDLGKLRMLLLIFNDPVLHVSCFAAYNDHTKVIEKQPLLEGCLALAAVRLLVPVNGTVIRIRFADQMDFYLPGT